jgi:hypothetical protein
MPFRLPPIQEHPFSLIWMKEPTYNVSISAKIPTSTFFAKQSVLLYKSRTTLIHFFYKHMPEEWEPDSPDILSEKNTQSFRCNQSSVIYLIDRAYKRLYQQALREGIPPPFINSPIFRETYFQKHFISISQERIPYCIQSIEFIWEEKITQKRLVEIARQLSWVTDPNELSVFASYIALLTSRFAESFILRVLQHS